jgi:hypothetical protein
VAQRNRAAVGVDARVVTLQAERLLRSEPKRLRSRWTERANSWRNLRPQITLCHPHVVLGLQVQPESWFHFEEQAQTQRGLRRNGAFAVHDLTDPAWRNVNVGGKLPSCNPHWNHEILFKNLARMNFIK